MVGTRNSCKIIMEKPFGKRPLLRTSRTWKDKIKMRLRK
jgi:hypothetical protein